MLSNWLSSVPGTRDLMEGGNTLDLALLSKFNKVTQITVISMTLPVVFGSVQVILYFYLADGSSQIKI